MGSSSTLSGEVGRPSRGGTDERDGADVVSDAAADHHERGSSRRRRGTAGWLYLGLLTVVAVALAAVAVAVDGPGGRTRALPGVVEPVALVLRVDGPAVALEGRVPGDEVRDRLVELAGARYGAPNVADQLQLDDRTTLDGGAVAVVGTTAEGDPNPLGLQADIAAAFLLRSGPVRLDAGPGVDDGGPSVAMVPPDEG